MDPAVLAPGTVVADRFVVRELLGRGAMGAVYAAEQRSIGRTVALKLVRPEHLARPKARERFEREVRAISRLDHPNIVKVYDFGVDHSLRAPFIAMEHLAAGSSLAALLALEGTLPLQRAIALLLQVAAALVEAHHRGVVHRDLKPDNLYIRRLADGTEHVTVLDFGVARLLEPDEPGLTATGALVGTPLYMSPEQAAGQPASPQSDLYSLGCIAFEVLSGAPPFPIESPVACLVAHTTQPPPPLPPPHPTALTALVAALLSKDPARRPDSAAAVAETLSSIGWATQHQPAPVVLPVPRSPVPRSPTSRWAPVILSTVVALAAGGAAIWVTTRSPAPAPTPATPVGAVSPPPKPLVDKPEPKPKPKLAQKPTPPPMALPRRAPDLSPSDKRASRRSLVAEAEPPPPQPPPLPPAPPFQALAGARRVISNATTLTYTINKPAPEVIAHYQQIYEGTAGVRILHGTFTDGTPTLNVWATSASTPFRSITVGVSLLDRSKSSSTIMLKRAPTAEAPAPEPRSAGEPAKNLIYPGATFHLRFEGGVFYRSAEPLDAVIAWYEARFRGTKGAKATRIGKGADRMLKVTARRGAGLGFEKIVITRDIIDRRFVAINITVNQN